MTGTPLDRDRLAKLLGMFSSDSDGEIVNAARMAERLRRQSGLTWHDILRPVPEPRREREVESVDDALDLCEAYADLLTDWERRFISTLRRQRTPISPKQVAIIEQILGKVLRDEARAA
ncbi:MAG TPA: hypothetical protein VIM52_08025 [Stellaceae bacterium]